MKINSISKLLVITGLFLIANFISAKTLDSRFQILPLPQKIEIISESGLKGSELSFITAEGDFALPVLGTLTDCLPRHKSAGKGVVLRLTTDSTPESEEGYLLEVGKKGVVISARTAAGLFYGCQTLEQLMEDSRDFNLTIPQMKITDYPQIDYRAVHFDNKHHLDRTEYYYRTIDKLARYKINAVIWEIDDKLRFSRHPEIGAPNALSKQEVRAISRYAKERNIEITPLVQGLGHAGYILKHHWELRENPASDWEFCPSDPRTYDLQFDLYKDALEAMPDGKYLHIGGDEITAIGIDERCKATGKSAFELQMEWLKKVCDFAVAHGKTPIFWDDMPIKYAGLWGLVNNSNLTDEEVRKQWNTEKLDKAIEMFPKNCIYMRWRYEDPTTTAHRLLLEWYQKTGLQVMAATAAATGNSCFMPRKNSRAQYIKDFSTLVAENRLCGILATAWDDGSPHLETIMRGYIAQGEYGWNYHGRNVEAFITAHGQREFALSRKHMEFLKELEQSAFFFDKALITSGSRNPAWGVKKTFTLLELPDAGKPGEWCRKYAEKIREAATENERYQSIEAGIKEALAASRRNRYTLEVYRQTNHLFHYPAQVILGLEAYDKAATDEARKQALGELESICQDFTRMRSELENVYSQTRFMQNAAGYIADHNHHNHLAALTDNSDWWFLYELPMTQKVKKWLTSLKP